MSLKEASVDEFALLKLTGLKLAVYGVGFAALVFFS
jgi:hypothetical protein